MIRINPGLHLDIVSIIIQSKYLGILIFAFALGTGVPSMAVIFNFLLTLIVYLFPWYLLFTLLINQKTGWAVGLVIWMGLSFIPMYLDVQTELVQFVFGYLPFLFLVIFCCVLNFKLRDWGYRQQSGDFPLWY